MAPECLGQLLMDTIQQYIQAGLSTEAIGALLGITGRAVRYRLRRQGLQTLVREAGKENVSRYRQKATRRSAERRTQRKIIVWATCLTCLQPYALRRPCLVDSSHFCSLPCKYAHMDSVHGEAHWNWRGGSEQYRGTKEYQDWRTAVYRRDGFRCRLCPGQDLIAHHLYNYATHMDKRLDIGNGITLCVTCHNEFHTIYGRKNNSPEQFEEFESLRMR